MRRLEEAIEQVAARIEIRRWEDDCFALSLLNVLSHILWITLYQPVDNFLIRIVDHVLTSDMACG